MGGEEAASSPHLSSPASFLQKAQVAQLLRWMLMSRELDHAELRLLRQHKVYFSISAAGHEAIQVATASLLRPGVDWFFPYYRDRALCLALGVTPEDMLLQAMGKVGDPSSSGRQMPAHWGNEKLNIVSQSSPTGTQFLHAVGAAEVKKIARSLPPGDDRPAFKPDELVYVSSGEGSTSEGEFFEALNHAILKELPVLFVIQDNGWAISTRVEEQTPGGSISAYLNNVPGLEVIETNGLDVFECYNDISRAIEKLRSGAASGPVLVHAHVVRLLSHSNSDDQRNYRSEKEIKEAWKKDPISLFKDRLVREEWLTQAEISQVEQEVREAVQSAIERVEDSAEPITTVEAVTKNLFNEDTNDPSEYFDVETSPNVDTSAAGEPKTLIQSIQQTLVDEMARDSRIVVFGEDVADYTDRDLTGDTDPETAAKALDADPKPMIGKGGVFKATHELQGKFGKDRVFNTPIAEAAIVGRAVGMALRGLRPVVEIQFFDYIWPAMMQIKNELAIMRWRSDGRFQAPVVIRVPIGGYLKGGSIYHSQTGESIFCHCPGLRVVFPSNGQDAAGLLRTAIRSGDPVLFLEHKHLYRQPYTRTPYPGEGHRVPFGSARIAREGTDLTIVTYGALVQRSLEACETLQKEHNLNVEVIDLRSLKPFDFKTIEQSVRKTSRVIVASEECADFGVAAEIAAKISDELFLKLDAPVRRIGALDTPVPYNPGQEEVTLPQIDDLIKNVLELSKF